MDKVFKAILFFKKIVSITIVCTSGESVFETLHKLMIIKYQKENFATVTFLLLFRGSRGDLIKLSSLMAGHFNIFFRMLPYNLNNQNPKIQIPQDFPREGGEGYRWVGGGGGGGGQHWRFDLITTSNYCHCESNPIANQNRNFTCSVLISETICSPSQKSLEMEGRDSNLRRQKTRRLYKFSWFWFLTLFSLGFFGVPGPGGGGGGGGGGFNQPHPP